MLRSKPSLGEMKQLRCRHLQSVFVIPALAHRLRRGAWGGASRQEPGAMEL